MINENQRTLNRVQIFLDLFCIPLAFLLAYFFRFELFNGTNNLPFETTIFLVFVLMPVYFLLYSAFGLYSWRRTKPFYEEIASIIYANAIATLLFVLILYIGKIMHFSRYAAVLIAIFNTLITISSRLIIRFTKSTAESVIQFTNFRYECGTDRSNLKGDRPHEVLLARRFDASCMPKIWRGVSGISRQFWGIRRDIS